MGFTVVFWSPISGQAGTTSNLIASASLLGLEYSSRLLLLGHLQSEYAAIERGFYPRRSWISRTDAPSDAGIDALLRLLQNRKLEPNRLRDYTTPLLADRLDILPGSNKPDASFVSAAQEWLAPLLELTRRAYDLVLLDGGSGNVSAWTAAAAASGGFAGRLSAAKRAQAGASFFAGRGEASVRPEAVACIRTIRSSLRFDRSKYQAPIPSAGACVPDCP
ncbi:hypothetical protein LJK87_33125 [Paenibacillus sp. P25]|nr:hypothetical protein LJK87_33125 [Paenibacillus sp. P25]